MFTYFTVLSNIFIDIMLLIFLIKDVFYLFGKNIEYRRIFHVLKLCATTSIALTFIMFNLALAPFFPGGISKAYFDKGAYSMFLHIITPILAVVDFMVFEKEYDVKYKDDFYTVIPPLIYLVFVIIIGQLGFRWGEMIAPYNFLNYGAGPHWFGFSFNEIGFETLGTGVFYNVLIIWAIIYLVGLLLIKIRKRIN